MSARYALVILTLLNLLNCLDRWLLVAVMPEMSRDLQLSHTATGLIMAAFTIGYFVTSPLFAFLSDRFSRVRLIAVGTAVWSLTTCWAAIAQNAAQLFLLRTSVGVGEAAGAAASQSLLFDFYPRSKRNHVMAAYLAAIPIGAALGFIVGGYLTHRYGWRSAFLLVGLPSVLTTLLVFLIREPVRGVHDSGPAIAAAPLKADLKTLVQNKVFMNTVYGSTALAFVTGGLAAWTPQFLVKVRALSTEVADVRFGLITASMGVVGSLFGGWCGHHFLKRRPRGDLLFSIVAIALGAPLTLVFFLLKAPIAYFGSLAMALFFLVASQPSVGVASLEAVPVQVRGLSIAVTSFIAHLFGDLISVPLVGYLADTYSLDVAVLMLPIGLVPCAWFYARAYRHHMRAHCLTPINSPWSPGSDCRLSI